MKTKKGRPSQRNRNGPPDKQQLKVKLDDLVKHHTRVGLMHALDRSRSTLYAWANPELENANPSEADAEQLGRLWAAISDRTEEDGVRELRQICGFKMSSVPDLEILRGERGEFTPMERIPAWTRAMKKAQPRRLGDAYRRVAVDALQTAFEVESRDFVERSASPAVCVHWHWMDSPLKLLRPNSPTHDYFTARLRDSRSRLIVRSFVSFDAEPGSAEREECRAAAEAFARDLEDFRLLVCGDPRTGSRETHWWMWDPEEVLGYYLPPKDPRAYADALRADDDVVQANLASSQPIRMTRLALNEWLDAMGLPGTPGRTVPSEDWRYIYPEEEERR